MTREEQAEWCDGRCAPDECVCVSAKMVAEIVRLRAELTAEKQKYPDAVELVVYARRVADLAQSRAKEVKAVMEAAEEETKLHGVDVGADGTIFVNDCDCRLCQAVREWRLNA